MSYGDPYIMKTTGYIHDGWFVLRPGPGIDVEYLYFALVSPLLRRQFDELACGAIVKNISGDLVKKAIVPVPPAAEQRLIVTEIEIASEECDRLASLYRRKLAALAELKQAVLRKAFAGEL